MIEDSSDMPAVLPEITLRAAAVVPPITVFFPPTCTNAMASSLAIAAVPAALVPIRLPRICVPRIGVLEDEIRMPVPLPEITFRAAGIKPPITLLCELVDTDTPF